MQVLSCSDSNNLNEHKSSFKEHLIVLCILYLVNLFEMSLKCFNYSLYACFIYFMHDNITHGLGYMPVHSCHGKNWLIQYLLSGFNL